MSASSGSAGARSAQRRGVMIARRYQLRKDAVSILMRGNPWLFREQMSSAAPVFPDGQWLRLYGHANTVVGYGIYEAEGAIAIRLLRRGDRRPDADWVQAQVLAAIDRRRALAARTAMGCASSTARATACPRSSSIASATA